jgi:outer membrane protein TolC
MTKRIGLTIILLSCLSLILAVEQLSLESAKKMLLQQNLDYLSVQASKEKAEQTEKSAFYSFLPSASLSGTHTRYEPELVSSGDYSNQIGLSVSQPLLANGSIYFNNKIQKENRLSSEVSVKQKKVEILSQLEILYYSALESQKNLAIVSSSLERAQKAYETGKIKFQQSLISKNELLKLQIDVTNKLITVINNRSSYNDAYRALQVYLNTEDDFELQEIEFVLDSSLLDNQRKLGSNFTLEQDGSSVKGNLAYQSLLKRLVDLSSQENPQISLAKSGIKIATYAVKQQQASFLPTLNLSLNTNWSATENSTEYDDQTTLMLNASLSLFPLVNKYHNVNAQKMNLKAVNYNYQSLLKGIESSLETALNSYLTSLEKIRLAELTFDLNKEIFQQMTTKFQANLISVDDYLDAQVEMDQAQEQYNSSLYGFLKSQSSLCRTIGLENSSELSNIITLVLEEK